MSASQRRKGKTGELEVVHILQASGWTGAKRTSDGRGQFERGDIAGGPAGIHWEVKRRETLALWEWLTDAQRDARYDDVPVVAFRRSRSQWYVALALDDLLALLNARGAP